MQEFKLENEVLAHIAQVLQLAILTGTDITEQLSLMRLSPSSLDPSKLSLSTTYVKDASENIDKLIEKAEKLAAEMAEEAEPVLGCSSN